MKNTQATLSNLLNHHVQDPLNPYDVNSPAAEGLGPHDTLVTGSGLYKEQVPNVRAKWGEALNCSVDGSYPTGWSEKILKQNSVSCLGDI